MSRFSVLEVFWSFLVYAGGGNGRAPEILWTPLGEVMRSLNWGGEGEIRLHLGWKGVEKAGAARGTPGRS